MTPVALACLASLVLAALPWWADGRSGRLRSLGEPPPLPVRAVVPPLPTVDVAVLLALLDAAIGSGAALPRALGAVGRAVGGGDGGALARAGAALVLGAGWDAAWSGAPDRLRPVVECLRSTWTSGTAPGPALRVAAAAVLRDRRTAGREAAGRLGVRLVLPLGLCFLPAFVLIGLVPVLLSVSGQVAG